MPYKLASALTLTICLICLIFAATSFAGTTTTYDYDGLNRLKEVKHADGNGISYNYDKIGNLESKIPFGNVFTITASATEGGILSPLGTATITAGSSKSYSFTPLYGYRVVDVVVDGVSKGAIATFSFTNLAANHTIAANFAPNATAWVQGSVKNSANIPLADIEVQLRNADSSLHATVKTAVDGSYRLGANAGSWLVAALTEKANWSPVIEQSVTLTTGQTATANFITNALTVTSPTLADGIFNTLYSQTVAASGGKTPYSWSLTTGTLPTGLTLNTSTGAITGMPTVAGTSSFTVQVLDASGFKATKALTASIKFLPIKTLGSIAVYNTSLQAAYNAAANGATIYCQAVDMTENLSFGLNKTITIIGGYDSLYSVSSGVTTIHGTMKVIAGAVPMKSVNLQY